MTRPTATRAAGVSVSVFEAGASPGDGSPRSADATVRTVWNGLVADFPAAASYERSLSVAVNADYARMDHTLTDGDEVAFLPPVSGG